MHSTNSFLLAQKNTLTVAMTEHHSLEKAQKQQI